MNKNIIKLDYIASILVAIIGITIIAVTFLLYLSKDKAKITTTTTTKAACQLFTLPEEKTVTVTEYK